MKQERDEHGCIKATNGKMKYRNVRYNNVRMSEHCREMCMALGIFTIPKGFVIHHLDENKLNNDIHNLALMSITAHNRVHSHEAWNKGLTKETNEVFKNAHEKAQKFRKITFLNRWKETYELRETGKTFREISLLLGITRETASRQYNSYKNNIEKNGKQ